MKRITYLVLCVLFLSNSSVLLAQSNDVSGEPMEISAGNTDQDQMQDLKEAIENLKDKVDDLEDRVNDLEMQTGNS